MTRQEIMLNEYRNRIEVADNVLSETRAKLTKAEHDRDRYKAEIERLKAENEELTKVVSSKVYDLIDNTKEIADAREAWEKQAKIEAVKDFAEKLKDYINDKIIEEFFDMAVGIKYFTIDIDEFEEHVDELLKEYKE